MNLNLGCGFNKKPDYINVDMFEECELDVRHDLEVLPWPWPDNSVDRVLFNHSLEHIGQSTSVFLGIIKELYRVCRNGAQVDIHVPHPRHDDFINDPTHVRIITPELMWLFSREVNDEYKARGVANSRFAHYLHVDFHMVDLRKILDEPYLSKFQQGLLSIQQVDELARSQNNVIREYEMTLIVHKPE